MNAKRDYRIKLKGHRDGQPFFDLIIPGRKAHRLSATDKAGAKAEAAALYAQLAAQAPPPPQARGAVATLRDAFTAYLASATYDLYGPLTRRDRGFHIKHILAMPVPSGGRLLGESLLSDWLSDVEAPDAVRRVMASCGDKHAQANHYRKALNEFFKWLLADKPEAAEARRRFVVSRHARNPVTDVAKAEPVRSKDGKLRRGHMAFTDDQVADWLHAASDDPKERFVVKLLQITGARISDLIRLNRGMIRQTPEGRVLMFTAKKGMGSAFRDESTPCVPMVPELEALIDALPKDQFMFIVGEGGRPFACTESLGNRIRKWRRAAGLPEGLSAHGMRKSATFWWLDNHADLIPNNFALKAIFGWSSDKELDRYTRDYNRLRAARGMLIRLADRRKARAGS